MKSIITLIFFSFLLSSLHAQFTYLGRSEEGLLMGDAYITLGEDEKILFYNPAAMGRHKGISLSGIAPTFHIANVVDVNFDLANVKLDYDRNLIDDFPEDSLDIANKLFDIPVYLQSGITPTIKIKHFALSYFYNSVFDMKVENAIRPEMNLHIRDDKGIIIGYAHNFKRGYRRGLHLSLGMAAKSFYRRGIDHQSPLLSPEFLDVLDDIDGGIDALRDRLDYAKGQGMGFDTGIELNYYASRYSRLGLGFSILDIGDIKFTNVEGDRKLPPQKMSFNFGTSWNQKFRFFDYTLAMDFSNLLDPYTSDLSKIKVGLRTRLPIFDLYWGINGGYISWGIGFKLFTFWAKVGFYKWEIGHDFERKGSDRILLSIDLLNIDFSGNLRLNQ